MMINFFIFIFSFSTIISQSDENGKSYYEFITNNPSLYKNEICSYNGYPNVKEKSIECDCYSSFVNEPRKEKVKYIGDQKGVGVGAMGHLALTVNDVFGDDGCFAVVVFAGGKHYRTGHRRCSYMLDKFSSIHDIPVFICVVRLSYHRSRCFVLRLPRCDSLTHYPI